MIIYCFYLNEKIITMNTNTQPKTPNTQNQTPNSQKPKPKPHLVKVSQVDADRVIGGQPSQSTLKDPPISFYVIPLSYDYGAEKPSIDNFFLEMPKAMSSGIISSNKYSKETIFMILRFSIVGANNDELCEKWGSVYKKIAMVVDSNANFIRMENFNINFPEASLKNPLSIPKDNRTKQPIAGRPPSMIVKLHKRKFASLEEKTLFIDPKGNKIDWKCLYNADVELIPVIQIDDIFIGAQNVIRLKMVSAIVTDLRPRNSLNRQIDTLDELSQDTEVANKVEEQVKKMLEERENFSPEELTKSKQPSENESMETHDKPMRNMLSDGQDRQDRQVRSMPEQNYYQGANEKRQTQPPALQTFLQSNPSMMTLGRSNQMPQTPQSNFLQTNDFEEQADDDHIQPRNNQRGMGGMTYNMDDGQAIYQTPQPQSARQKGGVRNY